MKGGFLVAALALIGLAALLWPRPGGACTFPVPVVNWEVEQWGLRLEAVEIEGVPADTTAYQDFEVTLQAAPIGSGQGGAELIARLDTLEYRATY